MKNGIYGIASLNGASIDAGSCAILLAGADTPQLGDDVCLLRLQDMQHSAVHAAQTQDGFCTLLGHLSEAEDAAATLGLDARAGIAGIAAAAHDRWGADMASRLPGEWTMVRWHAAARRLTLVMGQRMRDHCYYASDGGAVALSPDLTRIARLAWIDGGFDGDMLLRAMGNYAMRESMDGRTIVKGVRALRAGEQVVIDAAGVRHSFAAPAAPPPLRQVSFDDAIDELRDLLDRIVLHHLQRGSRSAVLLSGGLDSSLLAALGAAALPADQLVFLTSAAPPGSMLKDETDWAGLVSQHLGVPMTPVAPDHRADVYRPSSRTFAAFETPLQSPRHYLYEALEDAALAAGAEMLVDGAFGELTISNDPAYLGQSRRPAAIRALARLVRRRMARPAAVGSAVEFFAQPSPAALAQYGRAWDFAVPDVPPSHDGAFGILPGVAKAARQPTHCSVPALRGVYPFRDQRLIEVMAGYPAAFAAHRGRPRAPIRHLMRGRLPRAIVERNSKLGFSPTYNSMLREQAGQALSRLNDEQVGEASQWLDVPWLKQMLARIGQGSAIALDEATTVQATAGAVEFFRWWKDARR